MRIRRKPRRRRKLAVVGGKRHDLDAARKLHDRVRGGDHQPADVVVRQRAGRGRHPAVGIHDDPCGVRARNASHRQLRVVGDGRADPDDDGVDQRAQAMQVGETGLAIDVVRVSGGGRHPRIDRLAALPDENEVVDRPPLQRTEDILPRLREGTKAAAERCGNQGPRRIRRRIRARTRFTREPRLGGGTSPFAPLGKAPVAHPGYLLPALVSSCHDILLEPGCQRPHEISRRNWNKFR
jgi:hypothetical protein